MLSPISTIDSKQQAGCRARSARVVQLQSRIPERALGKIPPIRRAHALIRPFRPICLTASAELNSEDQMAKFMKQGIAACAGAFALACSAAQPAGAADIPAQPQYSAPQVRENYVYREQRYVAAPPPVVYEYAPRPVVVVPEPYYIPRRRVFVRYGYPGYGYAAYGYGPRYRPHFAGGYGYHRGWGHGHRRW